MDCYNMNMFDGWDKMASARKPIIAGVNGFCLGGGCELAMMCDFIVAGNKAKFGQPEITLGTIPGIGGTQRMLRAVGKSKAMDLILTGDFMGAEEAKDYGLVSRIFPAEDLEAEVLKIAEKVAGYSKPATMMAKEAVNEGYELTLKEGVKYERRLFFGSFASKDQKEGMAAFVEKRAPTFTDC